MPDYRHAGMGWPNGAVDRQRIYALPSQNVLMLVTEARYWHDEAVRAGKQITWRAVPRIGKRPAELGWSPGRFVDEALNLTDEAKEPIRDFLCANELDLNSERGDHADDYDGLDQRYTLLGGFLFSVLTLLRQRLPGTRLHFPAFTPDHDALLYVDKWRAAAELADVLTIHAYDTLEKIQVRYYEHRQAFPDARLELGEWHGKGDVEEERRILTWLADTMAADPLFDAAYRFIWRWDGAPGWWSPEYDVESNPAMVALFMDPPVAKEEPVPDFPIPVDDAGNEWAPSKQDIIDGAIAVADEAGLPRDLMLALCLAESGEGLQSFERWYYFTDEAKGYIVNRNRAGLQSVLDRIAAVGTNDISFGPCHQTWRWSPEYNGNPYDLQAILEFRKLYIQDHGHALRVARDQIARFWATYGPDKRETLARYNKPDGTASASVRARYASMLELARGMLPAEPGGVVFEDFRDPQPAGTFPAMPRGVILHGSRSGKAGNPKAAEYAGTANWEVSNPNDLGWHATIGENRVAVHLAPHEWGWNARGSSSHFLAVELAQATVDEAISDAQVDAFCAWLTERALPVWPGLPLFFQTHAELDGTPEYGQFDGKSDVFPAGDGRADELRARIMARLKPAPTPEPKPAPDPTFTVGEGLLAKMAALGDTPASDETFHELWSEALGISGLRYLYFKATGEIAVYPPTAA